MTLDELRAIDRALKAASEDFFVTSIHEYRKVYRLFSKEAIANFSALLTLAMAAKRVHDECSSYFDPNKWPVTLNVGPMLEPSEQSVLELRAALKALEDIR